MTNPYFATKPRPTPPSLIDSEMLLLKMMIKQTLVNGGAIEYPELVTIFWSGQGLRIVQPRYPEFSNDFDASKLNSAVDRFVDYFIYTQAPDLNNVLFENTKTRTKINWRTVRSSSAIAALLCDQRHDNSFASWYTSFFQ